MLAAAIPVYDPYLLLAVKLHQRTKTMNTSTDMLNLPSLRVDGRVALVTGAGSGLGQAMANGLAQAGANVAVTELPHKLEAAEVTAAQIRAAGQQAMVVPLDVMDLSMIKDAVDQVVAKFGRIDILINNAGINIQQMALDVTEEAWDRVMAVTLKGVFFCAQAVARQMLSQAGLTAAPQPLGARGEQDAPMIGKIINISSQMGVVGYQLRAAYCSSKAGVVNLTRVLAFEWAQYGINVNAIAPTFIRTPLTAPMFENETFKADVLNRIPLGRLGKAEDVVGAAVYLASPAADMVTGHTMLIDGGWTVV
jgi:2-deoxy-D-gluconate 3-dehydrogenase